MIFSVTWLSQKKVAPLLMESVHNLQQTPYSISRHTLVMLLHYLGKLTGFKFAANIEQTKQNALIFAGIHINGSRLLLTYLLRQFMVPVKR